MRGSRIQEHFAVRMTPREGDCLRGLLEHVVQLDREDQFGLNELEDEIVAALLVALEDDGAASDLAVG